MNSLPRGLRETITTLTGKQLWISLVIVTCLGLQMAAVLNGIRHFLPWLPQDLWPFLNYPMYRNAYAQGEPIDQFVLFGVTADSTVVRLIDEDFGLNFWKFKDVLVPAVRRHDRDELEHYLDAYRRSHNQELIALRLETHPVIPGKTGPISLPPTILSYVELHPDDSGGGTGK